jgi:hypothetical protein
MEYMIQQLRMQVADLQHAKSSPTMNALQPVYGECRWDDAMCGQLIEYLGGSEVLRVSGMDRLYKPGVSMVDMMRVYELEGAASGMAVFVGGGVSWEENVAEYGRVGVIPHLARHKISFFNGQIPPGVEMGEYMPGIVNGLQTWGSGRSIISVYDYPWIPMLEYGMLMYCIGTGSKNVYMVRPGTLDETYVPSGARTRNKAGTLYEAFSVRQRYAEMTGCMLGVMRDYQTMVEHTRVLDGYDRGTSRSLWDECASGRLVRGTGDDDAPTSIVDRLRLVEKHMDMLDTDAGQCLRLVFIMSVYCSTRAYEQTDMQHRYFKSNIGAAVGIVEAHQRSGSKGSGGATEHQMSHLIFILQWLIQRIGKMGELL